MDTKSKQEFLTRGCKCAPQPHTHQLDVFKHSCNKLDATDWLKNFSPPEVFPPTEIVEIRFKNSRKEFFRASAELDLQDGDIVAVEASPGHDIGIVSLRGEIVKLQMRAKKIKTKDGEFRKVYRKAKVSDIEKWVASVEQENPTMFRSRGIASSLNLEMKISDVEYQGDRTKAIFYYTADDRVDFRELIRVLADAFGVRIEMRQIGMRQEASRLGGIGSCGRELCCATWMTKFRSVSTSSARTQQLSLNPQKLAGQCSKLKCCINYENSCYEDLLKKMPDPNAVIVTKKGKATLQKTDVLKGMLGYAYQEKPSQIISIPAERAHLILEMNRKNTKPDDLIDETMDQPAESQRDVYGMESQGLEDSLTRFDKPKKSKTPRRKRRKPRSSSNADRE